MPRTARPKTLDDIFHAQRFLELARGIDLLDTIDSLSPKRNVLATIFGKNSRLYPYQASERQVHTVFREVHERYVGLLNAYTHNPLPFLLATEQAREVDEAISERIAIMLDSCTPATLTELTGTFGAGALGHYAHFLSTPLHDSAFP